MLAEAPWPTRSRAAELVEQEAQFGSAAVIQARVVGQGRVAGTGEEGLQGGEDGRDISWQVGELGDLDQFCGSGGGLVGGEGPGGQGCPSYRRVYAAQ